MPRKDYIIKLKKRDKEYLNKFISKGEKKAREITRARILPLSDEGKKSKDISEMLKVSKVTITNIRKKFIEKGLYHALKDKARPGAPIKFDSRVEANITMIACSEPPEGRNSWTLQLIADKVIELKVAESISYGTVKNVLKKTL